MNLLQELAAKRSRMSELEAILQDPATFADSNRLKKINQEYSDLKEVVTLGDAFEQATIALRDAEHEAASDDAEMAELAREEVTRLRAEIESLGPALDAALVPPSPQDSKNVYVEIRAGAGGEEAALFASELFRLYARYAERHGWKTGLSSASRTDLGGFKEVIFFLEGHNAYRDLKFETGVHRVQRVPATEKTGRIHTSTVTVAVMPEVEDIDIKIDQKDIRIDTFLAGGHGGQGVQTTYSAVRVTYLPTGMIVSCQDERNQTQNKERAMAILRSRLYAIAEEKRAAEEKALRLNQVGTGDRSEKIRTYNFPQDRVTDHRIKKSWHSLPNVMDGEIDLIILAVRAAARDGFQNVGEDEDEG